MSTSQARKKRLSPGVSYLLTVLVAVALTMVAIVLVVHSREGDDVDPVAEPVRRGPAALVAIGPITGEPLASYAFMRNAALKQAAGRRAAVVSFNDYRAEGSAREALDSGGDVRVEGLLIAAPGGTPRHARDVVQWAEAERTQAREDKAEAERLLATVGDDQEYAKFYRDEIQRLERLVNLQPGGKVVFGAVVIADVGALRKMADRDDVRLVDVGPSDKVPSLDRVRGIRPEETIKAGTPALRPTP